MQITYHPEAEAELMEAARFFEQRSSGLGLRFLTEFDATVLEITRSPRLCPVIEKDVRIRTMRRFPFAIHYRATAEEVRILVVKHHNQHPDYGRRRLLDDD